jgi:hypothetical protein
MPINIKILDFIIININRCTGQRFASALKIAEASFFSVNNDASIHFASKLFTTSADAPQSRQTKSLLAMIAEIHQLIWQLSTVFLSKDFN